MEYPLLANPDKSVQLLITWRYAVSWKWYASRTIV